MGTSALDPMADQRMLAHGSVILMLGPAFMGETRATKALDPALTFDRMITAEDRSHVPSFIDLYISNLGIDIVLTGDEMVPRREVLAKMVRDAAATDLADERWARPCARLGNYVALAIRAAAKLPVEPSDSAQMINDLTSMAEKFYARALKDPALETTVKANMALMQHWKGLSEGALAILARLSEGDPIEEEKAEIETKRAQVLIDIGRTEEASAILSAVPSDKRPERANDLLAAAGARQ